jgi:dTMP kinase
MKNGKLIVLEGIDGSGTTTQATLLVKALRKRGLKTVLTAEPSDGPAGKLVRGYLQSKFKFKDPGLRACGLALLFAADRLEHLSNQINPWLAQGRIVISDRYLLSSLAYQSLECDPDWVAEINIFAPSPDLTLLLDLPAETAIKRVSQRGVERDLFEKLEIQKKVRTNYLKLAKKLPRKKIIAIDALQSIEDIAEEIFGKVLEFI